VPRRVGSHIARVETVTGVRISAVIDQGNAMKRKALLTRVSLAAVFAFAMSGCAGGDADGPTSPSPNPGSVTITITSSGVSPQNVTVASGAQVTFRNSDTRPHDIMSDPHPEHSDCPQINQVGVIQPGNSRQTGNLNAVRTCGFHDRNQPSNSALQGSIRIQ
jgi:plastocyanin